VLTETDLRAFAAIRLAAFKVPRQVRIVEAIPRGPTGKPQRLRLAETLGLATSHRLPAVPRGAALVETPLAELLAGLWGQVLGLEHAGLGDDFF
jgi:hypothetical protein